MQAVAKVMASTELISHVPRSVVNQHIWQQRVVTVALERSA